jgi:hypothetical protein
MGQPKDYVVVFSLRCKVARVLVYA